MNVNQYVFQSPSTSQVQVGKLDSSTKNDANVQKEISSQNKLNEQTEQNIKEEKTSFKANRLLDIYV